MNPIATLMQRTFTGMPPNATNLRDPGYALLKNNDR
jgi:hypothetical protein